MRFHLCRAVSDRLMALLCALLVAVALVGCGGSRMADDDTSGAPDYLADLRERHYWAAPTVTYRFVGASTATDIHGQPIRTVPLSEQQKQAARRAFAAWEFELSADPTTARRFVEAEPGAPADIADIDVVVRDRSDFEGRILGRCTVWRRNGVVAMRAVIQVRADLSEREFAHVMLHEAGHAVMSTDHSPSRGDVMHPTATGRLYLSARDGVTARRTYQSLARQLPGQPVN